MWGRFDNWPTALAVSHDKARQVNDKGKDADALTSIGSTRTKKRRPFLGVESVPGAVRTVTRCLEGTVEPSAYVA